MNSEHEQIYIMRDDNDDEEWVRPTPASAAIADAVTEATDLDEADLRNLDSYLDRETLRALLEGQGNGERTFTVEGHDVTITAAGDITVE